VNREDAKTGRKTTNAALLNAVHNAKNVRLSNNAALSGARRRLANRGDEATVRNIDAVLAQPARSGADPEELATQLDQLRASSRSRRCKPSSPTPPRAHRHHDGIRHPAHRGDRGPRPSAPEQTEQLDLLDGYAIRPARPAPPPAEARISGQEAIAKAFELTALYRNTSRRSPTTIRPAGVMRSPLAWLLGASPPRSSSSAPASGRHRRSHGGGLNGAAVTTTAAPASATATKTRLRLQCEPDHCE
jgi:hypothetical protein